MLKNIINENKGFTILELVVVIAILLIITAVAIPSITALLGRSNEKIDIQKQNAFLAAAREYVNDNYNTVLPTGKTKCYVTIETLHNQGYLSDKSYIDSDGNEYKGNNYYIVYEYKNGINDKYDYNISKSGLSKCLPS